MREKSVIQTEQSEVARFILPILHINHIRDMQSCVEIQSECEETVQSVDTTLNNRSFLTERFKLLSQNEILFHICPNIF